MKAWDELSEVEQLQCLCSDASKDARGYRNRNLPDTVEELKELLEMYSKEIGEEEIRRNEMEQLAIVKFEERVTATIKAGAGNRATALRWIFDAEDEYSRADKDYFCYNNGLPYGYFKEAA